MVNDKGDSVPVAKSGTEREKAERAIAIANGEEDGKRGKGVSKTVARGKPEVQEAAAKNGKTTTKRGKKAAAEPVDGG